MGSLSNPYNAVLVSQCSQSATTLNYFDQGFHKLQLGLFPASGWKCHGMWGAGSVPIWPSSSSRSYRSLSYPSSSL